MRWQRVKKLPPEQFKRLVGVKRITFETMVLEAKRLNSLRIKKIPEKNRGPKEKLNWYDKALMVLMYYRELMSVSMRSNVLKKQPAYYSGKKKKHSLKSQLVIDKKTVMIISRTI